MFFPGYINWLLLITGGICWLITYLLIIYRSFKDKSYGMPFTGLALNISWEFLYGFAVVPVTAGLQTWVNRCWFILDVFIVIAYLRYGRNEWNEKADKRLFIPHFIFSVTAAFLLLYFFEQDFEKQAITYSAFLMNLLFSGLYIQMFFARKSLKGQSFGIAVFKMIGTGTLPSKRIYYFFTVNRSSLFGAGCCVFITPSTAIPTGKQESIYQETKNCISIGLINACY
jgi:hypothetical protein